MKNNKLLFSICIPTYNECKYLKNVLDSIVIQKEFIDKKVEIIVTDNCSTDGTDKLLGNYTSNYSNIIYVKNKTNIGSTENTILAVSKASGELVKISTSSTMYNEGSLKTITELINKYKNSNTQLYFSNIELKMHQVLNFKEFSELTSVSNTNYLTWSLWRENVSDYLKDHTFDWTNIPACYFNLKYSYKYDKVLIVNKKLFTQQRRKPKYLLYGVYKVFGKNIYDIYSYFIRLGALNNDFLHKLKKRQGYWLIDWVIVFEFKDKNYVFNDNENLKVDFINDYKYENYFNHLYFVYILKKIKYIIKHILKGFFIGKN